MTIPKSAKIWTASDGHLARVSGLYARRKLQFLEYYLPAALQATKAKNSRHFVDVFAGPGRNIVRGTAGTEFAGSPILAVNAVAASGRYAFHSVDAFNIDAGSHAALQARFAAAAPCGRRDAHLADGVMGAGTVLARLPRSAYVVLGLDIESAGQLPWDSLLALHRAAPYSTDAYILLPVGMGLVRQLSYERRYWDENEPSLTAFFGDESWKAALAHRASDGRHARQRVMQTLTQAYLGRLRTLWPLARTVCRVTRQEGSNQMLYYMILATRNQAGATLASWAADRLQPIPRLL